VFTKEPKIRGDIEDGCDIIVENEDTLDLFATGCMDILTRNLNQMLCRKRK
jgi:hypothetical protein